MLPVRLCFSLKRSKHPSISSGTSVSSSVQRWYLILAPKLWHRTVPGVPYQWPVMFCVLYYSWFMKGALVRSTGAILNAQGKKISRGKTSLRSAPLLWLAIDPFPSWNSQYTSYLAYQIYEHLRTRKFNLERNQNDVKTKQWRFCKCRAKGVR